MLNEGGRGVYGPIGLSVRFEMTSPGSGRENYDRSMGLELPVVCSLDESDRRNRTEAWAEALRRSNTIEHIPGGSLITFPADSGLTSTIEKLVAAESECCPWMRMELETQAGATGLRITSLGTDGEAAIRQIFRVAL